MHDATEDRDVARVEASFEDAGVGVHITHQTGSVAPVQVIYNVATVETARDVDACVRLIAHFHRAYQSGTLAADELQGRMIIRLCRIGYGAILERTALDVGGQRGRRTSAARDVRVLEDQIAYLALAINKE